jgi:predicted regulator of Ras-like GTPase activity (Roadblock/LC7/MglB family)
MKLPAGTDGGTITSPQNEHFFKEMEKFRGAVEIKTPSGTGFILVDNGRLEAAMFRTARDAYPARRALLAMTTDSGDAGIIQTFHLRRYNDTEYADALEICRSAKLVIADEESPRPAAAREPAELAERGRKAVTTGFPEYLDRSMLQKILSQPGVIAVSAFFEGFPVQSAGDADFEHVAASAEDFMRAGVKIARDIQAGPLEQMILETADNKFIIAPCGDLYLCVFTTADTQLGLIRVILKSIQSEISI